MKKVFAILAATVLFAGMASAQLGINVGFAPQTYKTTVTSGSTSTTSSMNLNGFFAGVNYNINLTGDLGVSLGANYRQNFGSDEETVSLLGLVSATAEYSHTQSLIDVPVLFNYGLKLTDDLKISVFLGPTFSFALAGNTHFKYSGNLVGFTGDTEGDTDWYGDNSDRKKFDISGTVGVNVQYNAFRLFGGYNMGFLNLTDADNTKLKASNWFVGLGFSL